MVKFRALLLAPLGVALLLAGCSKNIDTQEAVKAGVMKDLTNKVDVQNMDVNVTAVSFRGKEADATVAFSPKGAPAGQSITMKYSLQREGDEWHIKGRSLDAHSPVTAPGGDLPPGHPTMGGGPGPSEGGAAMPSGHPAMGAAPGAAGPLPAGHPQVDSAPKK